LILFKLILAEEENAYDTKVPLFFSGPGISQAIINRMVHPGDIAVTLATLLGIQESSGSSGTPLEEVLK
jgi:hypothetical protein